MVVVILFVRKLYISRSFGITGLWHVQFLRRQAQMRFSDDQ